MTDDVMDDFAIRALNPQVLSQWLAPTCRAHSSGHFDVKQSYFD